MPPRSRETLTPMQWRVLERLARGESNESIARALGIAPATVKAHTWGIFQRLPVARSRDKRAAAIAWYRAEMSRREVAGAGEE